MFKDAKQGVWDGVQEQILIRMLRKWGRRYKSDDEENLPVICRTIQLLYFTFCHIISTQSAPLYTCSPHPCWLSQLTFIVISFASSAGSISRVVGQAWQVWLAGRIDCFSITTFICFKDHFFSRCDKMIRLALFLGSAIVVARLIQTSLNKYFKISFLIQLFNLPFNFTFILHFQDQFCSLPVSPQSGSIRGKPIKVRQIIFEGI